MRHARRLVQKRSLRWEEGLAVLEGPDLVEAALETGQELHSLFVDAAAPRDDRLAAIVERARSLGLRVDTLAPGVLERVADARAPQPVLATVRFEPVDLANVATTGLVVVLDGVRDPGNAGTAIRSAEAAGADAVVLTGSSVDPYNPKTLRATAGAIFHLPVVVDELARVLDLLHSRATVVWAAVVRGGTAMGDADLTGPVAVVLGGEAAGLGEDVLARCDARLSIPMVGRAESLNLGVAASLVAFESLRQRQGTSLERARPSLGGS